MPKKVYALFFSIAALSPVFSLGQSHSDKASITLVERTPQSQWVDQILDTLTLEEKISQLLFLPVPFTSDDRYLQDIEYLARSHSLGGILFQENQPNDLKQQVARFQQASHLPLLMGI
ncbi:MAG: hypothetical protein ACFB15_00620, partial [Cyclobacteriaceae bacterium]